jgi:hypothetical protein
MRHVHGLRAAAGARRYATWNSADKGTNVTLSSGDLTAAGAVTWNAVRATQGKSTGKWYFELTITGATGTAGFGDSGFSLANYAGASANSASYYDSGPTIFANGFTSTGAPAISGTGTFQFAIDLDNRKCWLGKGGAWSRTSDPTTGSNEQWNWAGTLTLFPAAGVFPAGSTITANFGASAFANSVPSGFNPGWYL